MRLSWLENGLLTPTFWRLWGIFALKEVTLIWFLACHYGSLVGLCVQDYKSLCAAVTIYATLVDTKFDFYIFDSCDLGN